MVPHVAPANVLSFQQEQNVVLLTLPILAISQNNVMDVQLPAQLTLFWLEMLAQLNVLLVGSVLVPELAPYLTVHTGKIALLVLLYLSAVGVVPLDNVY